MLQLKELTLEMGIIKQKKQNTYLLSDAPNVLGEKGWKSMKLKPGNLIKVKSNPASYYSPTGKEPPVNYFFSEKKEHSFPISVGTVGLVISTTRRSTVGNLVIDVLFNDEILSIAQYDDQYGNPIWCDII
jgi:hypothetical protein